MTDKRKETIEKLDRLARQSSWERVSEKIDRMMEQSEMMSRASFWEEADRTFDQLKASDRTFSDSTELVREERDR